MVALAEFRLSSILVPFETSASGACRLRETECSRPVCSRLPPVSIVVLLWVLTVWVWLSVSLFLSMTVLVSACLLRASMLGLVMTVSMFIIEVGLFECMKLLFA